MVKDVCTCSIQLNYQCSVASKSSGESNTMMGNVRREISNISNTGCLFKKKKNNQRIENVKIILFLFLKHFEMPESSP